MQPRKILSVFSLVMINVIAVDNLRTLPVSAEYGFSLLFYYLLAGVTFMIPSALVAAELATGWPKTGGVYIWVREAFGKRMGFFTVWLQWIYNVVWYPTMLAFLAGAFAYLINPDLANNKIYMMCAVVITYLIATYINLYGMKASSIFSDIGALIGTIIPMLFISILGLVWIFLKKPLATPISLHAFWPNLNDFDNLSFLVAVYFGLLGMEMSAVHAEEVRNPQRDYPRALFYSAIIILGTLILASLAIAIVIPAHQLSLVTGFIEAYKIFFTVFHLQWLLPIIIILIILGGLSGVSAWTIGPIKSLMIAAEDGSIPQIFQKRNQYGAPHYLLITQAIIVCILSFAFLLLPTVNSSYWFLSVLTSQLSLIYYIVIFVAAIYLRYRHPNQRRAYQIPGGKLGIWLVCGIGLLSCIFVIGFSFLPPPGIPIGNLTLFETLLITGLLIFCVAPFGIYRMMRKNT